MSSAVERRKEQVQKLRAAAKECGVALVRDDVGQAKVTVFAEAIQASAGAAGVKASAAKAFAAYNATFPPAQAQPTTATTGPTEDANFRLRGKSFLATYNWDFLKTPLPDGTPPLRTTEKLWRLWRDWKAQKKAELQVLQSTSTLERSLRSENPNRFHIHWKTNLEQPLDVKTWEVFAFHGVKPDVRPTFVAPAADQSSRSKKARGANFLEASNRAHFYTWVAKRGTVYVGTNYKPFEDYRVLGKWLDDLWTDGKLEHNIYRELAVRVRTGYSSRKRDLEQVLAEEREKRVDARIAKVAEAQEQLKAPPRVFQAVRDWEDSFLHLDFRWKLLLLWADSASGKSTFAEGLFENPFLVTVEEAEHLDLKDFDFEKHDGLVLDNCNSLKQLLRWRAILQGRNAKSKGGQSATNLFAYAQYLFSVAVVVTVDLDVPDGYLLDKNHEGHSKWLVRNSVAVKLPRGETFYDASKKPAVKVENTFSLFAQTVKKRRAQQVS